MDFASGNQQVAEQQATELQKKLDVLQSKMAVAEEELSSKGARLMDLEGEAKGWGDEYPVASLLITYVYVTKTELHGHAPHA